MKSYFVLCVMLIAFVTFLSASDVTVETVKPNTEAHAFYIDDAPKQTPVRTPPIVEADYVISPFASFDIRARVLSAKRYKFDLEATVSPVDLALGWQEMSKDNILERIDISQNNRFYYWRYQGSAPTRRRNIITQSANMHMIPANDLVRRRLSQVKQDDIVTISGYLVRVDWNDGRFWVSSRTRKDTGAGACEIIYVTDIQIDRFAKHASL